ncbi:GFA family protein [Agrobacterium pusense]|uniref:GFA family protein n=1 Tax=Agrobacterium pusense TaxID=648995 RepID=UPI003FCF153D
MHIDGACQCRKITYEAEIDPQDVAICHCSDCQRLTGSAYRVTVSTHRNRFKITSGTLRLYAKSADCGSPVYTTGEHEDAEPIGIRLGTVNQRQELRPRSQIWCSSALPWAQSLTDLPGRAKD